MEEVGNLKRKVDDVVYWSDVARNSGNLDVRKEKGGDDDGRKDCWDGGPALVFLENQDESKR